MRIICYSILWLFFKIIIGIVAFYPIYLYAQYKDEQIIIQYKPSAIKGKIVIEMDSMGVYLNNKPLRNFVAEGIKVNCVGVMHNQLSILSKMKVHAILGVRTKLLDDTINQQGVIITSIKPNSPAYQAGLLQNDIICNIDGHPIHSPRMLLKVLLCKQPNDTVTIQYCRKRVLYTTHAVLEEPSDNMVQYDQEHLSFHSSPPLTKYNNDKLSNINDSLYFYQHVLFGLEVQQIKSSKGLKVISIENGSLADQSGFLVKDIILAVDNQIVNSIKKLKKKILYHKKGNLIFLVKRKDKMMYLAIKIAEPLVI